MVFIVCVITMMGFSTIFNCLYLNIKTNIKPLVIR